MHCDTTKAIHLAHGGISLVIVRDYLGHVDINSTEIYARENHQMKRTAIEKVSPAPIQTILHGRKINREPPHTAKMLCKAFWE